MTGRPGKDAEPDVLDRSAETRTQRSASTEESPCDAAPPPVPAREGTKLLHFEVVEQLGQGGMGVVYKALDTRLRRAVALKILTRPRGDEMERSLFREARRAAALVHPGIATVYDVYPQHDPPFFAMELVEGETLRAYLSEGPLPAAESVVIAIQLARALGHAHVAGIVHRDVKPENVMIGSDGAVKLLDFGIAKQLAPRAADPAIPTETIALTLDGQI